MDIGIDVYDHAEVKVIASTSSEWTIVYDAER